MIKLRWTFEVHLLFVVFYLLCFISETLRLATSGHKVQSNEGQLVRLLTVRFFGHVFAVFLDDLNKKNWHEHFREDDLILYPVDTYDMAFDDFKMADSLLRDYKNRVPVKDFKGTETLAAAKHILCARCDEVGFIVGGDEIEIAGKKGKYMEEEIDLLSRKWWEYWKEYWRLRGTHAAFLKDYACEVTIPVDKENPRGMW